MIVMQVTIDFLVSSKKIIELNKLMGENLPWEQKETEKEIKYYKLNRVIDRLRKDPEVLEFIKNKQPGIQNFLKSKLTDKAPTFSILFSSSAFIISPTDQSISIMASPYKPCLLFPLNFSETARGT